MPVTIAVGAALWVTFCRRHDAPAPGRQFRRDAPSRRAQRRFIRPPPSAQNMAEADDRYIPRQERRKNIVAWNRSRTFFASTRRCRFPTTALHR
jgi:hypothetical protein